MTNVVNALTLISKAIRLRKLRPAVVLAFVDIAWRTAAAFVVWNIYRRRLSLWDDEGVVDDNVLSGEIFRSMNMAIHFLERVSRKQRLFATTSLFHG